MGTRHLIGVVIGGKFKVAQYGQWDGYPSGQGLDVLRFLRGLNEPSGRTRVQFNEAVKECSFDKDGKVAGAIDNIELFQEDYGKGYKQVWAVVMPQFSRDAGAKILDLVHGGVRILQDNYDFGADGLFCEYAYVIDLDKNVLEVHSGFSKGRKVGPRDRWTASKKTRDDNQGYGPVQFQAEFPINNLPTDDDFVAHFKEED